MKNKNFFSSLILAIITNFTIKPLWLLTENWIQDKIGHQQFGIYGAILSLALMFMPLLDLGINQFFVKKVAQQQSNKLFSKGFTAKLILASIYFLITITIATILGYSINYFTITISLILYAIFITLIEFLRSFIKAFQFFKLDAFFSLGEKLILLPLVYIILPENAKHFAILVFLSALSSFIIYFTIFYYKIKPEIKLQTSKNHFITIIKSSISFGIMNLLGTITINIGKIFLERFSSSQEASLFIGGSRWVFAAEMYIWTILQIFYARFALYHNQVDNILKLLKKGLPIVGIPMLWTFSFILTWGNKLLFLFHNSTEKELNTMLIVMKIMATALILNGFFNIFSTYLTSNGYEKNVNKLLTISLTSHIILNFILMPYLGSIGIAISFVSAILINVMGYIILVHYKTPMNVPYSLIIKTIIIIILQITFSLLLKQYTSINWILQAILQGMFLIIVSFSLKLLKKDFYKLY